MTDFFTLMQKIFQRLPLFLAILFVSIFSFPPSQVDALLTKTLQVSFSPTAASDNMLPRGKQETIGQFVLEAQGGKLNVERITLNLTDGSNEKNIRRVLLYNDYGALIGSAGAIQNNAVSFTNLGPLTIRENEPVKLDLVLEVSISAKIGETIGFRLVRAESILVREQDYEEHLTTGTFPSQIGPFTIADADAGAFLTAAVVAEPEYRKYAPIGIAHPIATLLMHAHGGEITVKDLVLHLNGTLGDKFVTGVKLQNQTGKIVAGPVDATDRKIIFTDPIIIPQDQDTKLDILVNVPVEAGEGKELFFEIDPRQDIPATVAAKVVPVVAEDPLRTKSKKIIGSSIAFWRSWLNPKPRVLSNGEKDAILIEFEAQSTTENVDMKQVEVNFQGATDALENIRLIKKPGKLLGSAPKVTGTKLVFPVTYTLEPGKIDNFQVTADIRADAKQGTTIQVNVPVQEMIGTVPTYGGPATGSVFTIGAREVTTTLDVAILAPGDTIFPESADVPIAKITLKANNGNIEITGFDLALRGNMPENIFSDFRLVDQYGKIIARTDKIINGKISFKTPFPVTTGATNNILLLADIASAGKASFYIGMDSPADIDAVSLADAQAAQSTGEFPIKTTYVDIGARPATSYLNVAWQPAVGGKIARASKNVAFGSFAFGAVGRDVRIERIALTQPGMVKNMLENINLTGEDGTKYSGKATDQLIVFENPIRVDANTEASFKLTGDFNITANVGEVFQFEINGAEQIIAKTVGDATTVVANYPFRSSLFVITPAVEEHCPLQKEPACGRVYPTCEGLACEPEWKDFDNLCVLEKAQAVFVKTGECGAPTPITQGDGESPINENESGFSDVPGSYLYAKAITYIRDNGIVKGYEDKTYRPDSNIVRADFTKIVIEAKYTSEEIAGCIPDNSAQAEKIFFADVPASEWYAPYVCVAKVNNIVQGFPDGTFQPQKNVSFAEAAKIIAKVFIDNTVEDGKPWYRPYIMQLSNDSNIPMSISATDSLITRGEMAEMIYRIMAKITDQPSRNYADFK